MCCEAVGVGVQICLVLVDILHHSNTNVSGLHKIVFETVVVISGYACPYHICFTSFGFAYHSQVSMIESFAHRIDVSLAFAHGSEVSELFGAFLTQPVAFLLRQVYLSQSVISNGHSEVPNPQVLNFLTLLFDHPW